jgi:Arc/MetJ-type ribon-helix-helix transcriptional regulator
MPLLVPADIQERVEAQLATGAFQSEDEVLREAMDTLEHRQRSLAKLQAMVREAEESIAAGRLGVFDREAIKRDVRERLEKQGIVD